MQIVIDISEGYYELLKCKRERGEIHTPAEYEILKWIVLPKGHDRLIDAKELRQDIIAHKYSNSFCEEHHIDQSINVGMLNILIADAPTIIEVDKEG